MACHPQFPCQRAGRVHQRDREEMLLWYGSCWDHGGQMMCSSGRPVAAGVQKATGGAMKIRIGECTPRRWDYCIVGSGPAGMTLALELERLGETRILLVESGEKRISPDYRALSDLAAGDTPHQFPMAEAVNRCLGGTSATWSGRCLPFDAIDFETRDWVPHSGWPVDPGEIGRYYRAAGTYLKSGAALFTLSEAIPGAPAHIVPGFEAGDVSDDALERWSPPLRFGACHGKALEESRHISVLTGATCTELVQKSGRVDEAVLRTLSGAEARIRAGRYIICAGGLETTRLLMSSPSVSGRGGPVPRALGRTYQSHLTGKIALIRFSTPADATIFGFDRDRDGVYIRRRFTIAPQVQREKRLLNFAAWLDNPPIYEPGHGNAVLSFAFLALKMPLVRSLLAPPSIREVTTGGTGRPLYLAAHLKNILAHPFETLGFAFGFFFKRYLAARQLPGFFLKSSDNVYGLQYHVEQVPAPDNRVWLSDERDKLGMRRLRVRLECTDQDIDSILASHEVLDNWLRKCGVGRLEYMGGDLRASIRRQFRDGIHQLGTTRMGDDPETAVVNGDLRVFGSDNLYLCSSSTFPTSGQANPTFMIVAFAVRLAAHLTGKEAALHGQD